MVSPKVARFPAYYAIRKKRDRSIGGQMASENIRALYEKHPLRRETILARIQKQRTWLLSAIDGGLVALATCAQSPMIDWRLIYRFVWLDWLLHRHLLLRWQAM
jgi:hypothetical protein